MGEGMANDALIMPYISSANIACGYHAGDEDTIKRTIDLCLQYNIAIGIHPSFKDKQNFGRTEWHLTDTELSDLVSEQLFLFKKIADEKGVVMHHVKPHGALYNMAAKHAAMAAVIAKAVYSFNSSIVLYGLANSYLISEAAAIGLKTASEAFADRTYQPDGSLTRRSDSNALHNNAQDVIKQVLQVVQHKKVTTTIGQLVQLNADSICIHGDGVHALEFAEAIYSSLVSNGIKIGAV